MTTYETPANDDLIDQIGFNSSYNKVYMIHGEAFQIWHMFILLKQVI